MCLSPITILNPNKYISLHHKDRFLLQVPCGKCAECQSSQSNSWQYRTLFEFEDCISAGGFVMFDTLTYNEQNLPYMDDIIKDLPHLPCFNHKHITDFMKLLRINALRRFGISKIKYFISSEYGSLHHRPHLHILLFVYADSSQVPNISGLISSCWNRGLTDGIPYRSAGYVYTHNVVDASSTADILRTCNYVTKYVQKSCTFQHELDKRLQICMKKIALKMNPDEPEKYLESVNAQQVKSKLKRHINQFHRQSLHYGETALRDIDLDELYKTGVVYMAHSKVVKMPISLPMYYKRKLFYDRYIVNGAVVWQLNEDGKKYKSSRLSQNIEMLEKRLKSVCLENDLDFDCKKLAEYVYLNRGRIKGEKEESTLSERWKDVSLFAYLTQSDKLHVGTGISPYFVGSASCGFSANSLPAHLTPAAFIAQYVELDKELESQLDIIYSKLYYINRGKQEAFELKQRLTDLLKYLPSF